MSDILAILSRQNKSVQEIIVNNEDYKLCQFGEIKNNTNGECRNESLKVPRDYFINGGSMKALLKHL